LTAHFKRTTPSLILAKVPFQNLRQNGAFKCQIDVFSQADEPLHPGRKRKKKKKVLFAFLIAEKWKGFGVEVQFGIGVGEAEAVLRKLMELIEL